MAHVMTRRILAAVWAPAWAAVAQLPFGTALGADRPFIAMISANAAEESVQDAYDFVVEMAAGLGIGEGEASTGVSGACGMPGPTDDQRECLRYVSGNNTMTIQYASGPLVLRVELFRMDKSGSRLAVIVVNKQAGPPGDAATLYCTVRDRMVARYGDAAWTPDIEFLPVPCK
jgi:hypothetical protein